MTDCRVWGCGNPTVGEDEFCARHLSEELRVYSDGGNPDWSERWFAYCTEPGCKNLTTAESVGEDDLCWNHESTRHPERVCTAAGCHERISYGHRYCWDHFEQSPYYPYDNRGHYIRSRFLVGTMMILFAAIGLWAVVFGWNFFTNSSNDCASDLTWSLLLGPSCAFMWEEYDDELAATRRQAEDLADSQYDRCADGVGTEVVEFVDRNLADAREYGQEDSLLEVAEYRLTQGLAQCVVDGEAYYDEYVAEFGPTIP